MNISKSYFGKTPEGEIVDKYTLSNGTISIEIITYGGAITSINVPDRYSKTVDIALGFNTLDEYMSKANPHFGCITGRFAGRIDKGEFTIDGNKYKVTVNKPNDVHLHGGFKGLDKYVWKAEEIRASDFAGIKLTHFSPDGTEGFPGNLKISVEYKLKKDNSLVIDYYAETDKATPVVLTNHNYFNLNGEASGKNSISNVLYLNADKFLVLDFRAIPTGELRSVENTPMDFRKPTSIGARIHDDCEQLNFFGGYDHPWALNGTGMRNCVYAYSQDTGIRLDISCDQAAVVFYTGNGLNGTLKGKEGNTYEKHYGFCLETQGMPDSVNHPEFPSVIATPGKPYRQTTVWKFSVVK